MQPEDEKIDARDQRDGGWSWVQNDLYTFFLPIIGREATHLYQVMTYLIPTRANNPVFDLSLRVIGNNAMMSKTTVSKYLRVLERVGMIVEKPGGTEERPMLLLGDLRKLAKLGEKEIRRRMGVRVADSDDEGGGSEPPPDGGNGWPQGGPGSGDAPPNGSTNGHMEATAPEGSGERGVRVADSGADFEAVGEILRKTTIVDLVLSAKQGGTVREKGGNCPRNGGVLSATDDPFKVLNLSRKSLSTPPTPASGGAAASILTAKAEAKPNGKNFSHEGQEPETIAGLREAVAKVLRECGLSGRRRAAVIERAMCAEAGMTDERPNWNAIAERMIEARGEYSKLGRAGLLRIGPYRLERFFGEAIWRETGLWAIDEKRLEERRRL
jgi:hypothetical protein